jgi:hypothetical protein
VVGGVVVVVEGAVVEAAVVEAVVVEAVVVEAAVAEAAVVEAAVVEAVVVEAAVAEAAVEDGFLVKVVPPTTPLVRLVDAGLAIGSAMVAGTWLSPLGSPPLAGACIE